MATLNCDVPSFRALVRREYYTHKPEDRNIFDPVVAFAAQSVNNRILTFHCMFDFGMVRARVPLSALYWKEPANDLEPHFKVLWNCFGPYFSVTQFDYLYNKRAKVILKDKREIWVTYCFTVDWYDNPFSNEPEDAKNLHVCKADEGYYIGQPNNRMTWVDQNWVTRPFPVPPKDIKVDKEWLNVETFSDRWVAGEGDSFYYDIHQKGNPMAITPQQVAEVIKQNGFYSPMPVEDSPELALQRDLEGLNR